MADIKLRSLKGSPLTHEEVDNNFRQFINSASLSPDGATLSLFNSSSVGSALDIPLGNAQGSEYSIQFKSGSATSGSGAFLYNPITSTVILTGSVLIDGNIVAKQFHTQYVSSSVIFESGSTQFGNSSDDTHTITGSLYLTGSSQFTGTVAVIGSTALQNTDITGVLSVTTSVTAPQFIGALAGNADTATSASHAVNADTASYVDYANVANHPSYGDSDVSAFLNGNVNTDIIPDSDITYDLGSPTNRWRDLYLSQATIYLGDKALTVDANSKILIDGAEFAPKTAATASRVLWANVQGRPTVNNTPIQILAGEGLTQPGGLAAQNTFTTNDALPAIIELKLDTGSLHFIDGAKGVKVNSAIQADSALVASEVDYANLTGTVPTWNQDTTGTAATASYVEGSNVDGQVSSAASADTATTADTATSASQAENANTASFAFQAETASYAFYAVSASYEITKEVSASYADVAGSVAYSGLSGTIPTWNQDTTGTAATASYVDYVNVDNKPTIPVDISDLTDTGLLLAHPTTVPTASYIDYSNVDNTPTIPSDISDLTDSTGLLTHPDTVATASYISPTFISASAAAAGFGDGGVTDIVAGQGISINQATGSVTITALATPNVTGQNVIAPIAFARIDATSAGTGTNLSWGAWASATGTMDFTFGTARSNSNYTVVTDNETFDDFGCIVSNKTTTGFRITTYDASQGNPQNPSAYPFSLMVYDENPIVSVGVAATASLLVTASYNSTGDIITFTKGDGTTFELDIVDNNTNYYTTGGSFDSASGDLTITGNNAVVGATINLDGRYLTTLDLTGTTVLSGSSFPENYTFDKDLVVQGTLTAQQFVTEYVTSSVIFESGSTKFGDSADDTHEFTGSLYIDGSIIATGDITAFSSSDRRLKDNITPISSPIEKIMQIGGYEFDWNNKQVTHEGHDIGVIAQEIESILPELVVTRENGYKAVKYDKIVALLIEAIKDQQAQINELRSKL